jgi:hypothetical protein
MATRLRAGRSCVKIPVGARDLSLRNVQTGAGAHPAPFSVGAWAFSRSSTSRGLNLTTHLHQVSRLRTSGAVPLLPRMPSCSGHGQLLTAKCACILPDRTRCTTVTASYCWSTVT